MADGNDQPHALDLLQRQLPERGPFWALNHIHRRLAAHIAAGQPLPEPWAPWWDLMRLCLGTQSIALWLRDEPAALQRIQALAALAGQHDLAGTLSEALQGQPQPPVTVTFTQLDGDAMHYTTHAPAHERIGGVDWSGTDATVQMQCEGFASVVADLLLAERDRLPPLATHAGAPPGLQSPARWVATAMAAHAPHAEPGEAAAASLAAILRNASPLATRCLASGSAEALVVEHHAQEGLEADLHEFYSALWPSCVSPLLQVCRLHDGAALFCNGTTVGLTLYAASAWDGQRERMLAHARAHTWRDADELPAWLASAVCFAQGGGDQEHWLLVTEGALAGTVLLSDTDALYTRPRFASVQAFFAALHEQPARVLAASGNLHYRSASRLLEPVSQM